MRTRFHRPQFLFAIALYSFTLLGCIGASIVNEPTESQDQSGALDSQGNPLPGPFDKPEGGDTSPPTADAGEPSVFSTQVGSGHTPERPEDLCEVDIFFSLGWIEAEHDFECPLQESLVAPSPPRVTLTSLDSDREAFQEIYEAICDIKGWEFRILEEFWFWYSYSLLAQIPRHFEFKVETLVNGLWEAAAIYQLEIYCPWPPPPPCISEGC